MGFLQAMLVSRERADLQESALEALRAISADDDAWRMFVTAVHSLLYRMENVDVALRAYWRETNTIGKRRWSVTLTPKICSSNQEEIPGQIAANGGVQFVRSLVWFGGSRWFQHVSTSFCVHYVLVLTSRKPAQTSKLFHVLATTMLCLAPSKVCQALTDFKDYQAIQECST